MIALVAEIVAAPDIPARIATLRAAMYSRHVLYGCCARPRSPLCR